MESTIRCTDCHRIALECVTSVAQNWEMQRGPVGTLCRSNRRVVESMPARLGAAATVSVAVFWAHFPGQRLLHALAYHPQRAYQMRRQRVWLAHRRETLPGQPTQHIGREHDLRRKCLGVNPLLHGPMPASQLPRLPPHYQASEPRPQVTASSAHQAARRNRRMSPAPKMAVTPVASPVRDACGAASSVMPLSAIASRRGFANQLSSHRPGRHGIGQDGDERVQRWKVASGAQIRPRHAASASVSSGGSIL